MIITQSTPIRQSPPLLSRDNLIQMQQDAADLAWRPGHADLVTVDLLKKVTR